MQEDLYFRLIGCTVRVVFIVNSYVPNTCVDPPHDDKIEALHFQPRQRKSSLGHLAATASRDGKFKIWLLAEEQVIEGKIHRVNVCQSINHYVEPENLNYFLIIWFLSIHQGKKYAWSCQSVGYYGDTPCQDAAFSQDGSLLAVAYYQVMNSIVLLVHSK